MSKGRDDNGKKSDGNVKGLSRFWWRECLAKILDFFPLNHGSLRGKARLKSRRMPIISPLPLVAPHASKANDNQDNRPASPATINTNFKKTKAVGLAIYAMGQTG